MIVSHWLYPVQVLGPGNRLILWVQGCSRNCKGCISPELQDYNGTKYTVNTLANTLNRLISDHKLDGITISGGEPFNQKDELLKLCSKLETNDILVYTGYTYQELLILCGSDLSNSKISVLITNPYVEELNDDGPLRGSSNQEIIYINDSLKKEYEYYINSTIREQQLFVDDNAVYFAGIPPKGQSETIRKEILRVTKGGQNEH